MAFGSFTRFNGVNSPRIARLLEDGTLDVNFNFCFWSHNIVRTAVVQKMVKVIAGSFTSYNGVNNRITRIKDGGIDSGFTIGTAANNQIYAIALQQDEK
jgi:hypothetical protein